MKKGYDHPDLFDVCANRHSGNTESKRAFKSIRGGLNAQRKKVLVAIKAAGENGLTVDELSREWEKPPNAISGRFTELKMFGLIKQVGNRETRSGCSAGVCVAI